MKYFVIIVLFLFSCTSVDRVDNEEETLSWLAEVDKKVKTKKNIEVDTEADKLIVEQATEETQYYKDVDPNTRVGEIRRVEFLKPNKYGIKYAFALMDIEDNDRIMNKIYRIEIATFVETGGGGWDDKECTFVEIYYHIKPEYLEKQKMIALKELRGEYKDLIDKIVKNSTNE